jgi:hypothetical protein
MKRRFRLVLLSGVLSVLRAGSSLQASPPPPPMTINTTNVWRNGCGPMYSHDLLVDVYVNDSKKLSAIRWNPVGQFPDELWKGSGKVAGAKIGIVMYLVPKNGGVQNAIRAAPMQTWTVPTTADDGNGFSHQFGWIECGECRSIGKCPHGWDLRVPRMTIQVSASARANSIGLYCACDCGGTTHCYEN